MDFAKEAYDVAKDEEKVNFIVSSFKKLMSILSGIFGAAKEAKGVIDDIKDSVTSAESEADGVTPPPPGVHPAKETGRL